MQYRELQTSENTGIQVAADDKTDVSDLVNQSEVSAAESRDIVHEDSTGSHSNSTVDDGDNLASSTPVQSASSSSTPSQPASSSSSTPLQPASARSAKSQKVVSVCISLLSFGGVHVYRAVSCSTAMFCLSY